jgi:hypothetical protein
MKDVGVGLGREPRAHRCGRLARRANHLLTRQALKSEIFRFTGILIYVINLRPAPTEGRFAIVTIRRVQDAMDALASA